MDPVTMMVASIGMQFFNNYANNKKNDEIQAQQREFQIAAAEHDFERMRKAQATAAKLALELEAEIHKERVEDIEKSYDTLLDNFANSFAITDWPLNVLPFIMKGESFGTLFGGTAKSISMHCILTPSNCAWFNEYFYDDLDFRVEAEMNNTWNAQSTHPIVYYGGGWNRRQNNLNGGTAPSLIDLDDIALLKNKLKQIPTMIITPYFDPYLHFRVQLWGMGKDANTPFRIDVPHGEVEPIVHRIFSYDYSKDDNPEFTEDFFNTTMEEFVPYLTSLIGFVADKYFWSIYKILPILPSVLCDFPSLKKLYKNNYSKLATDIVCGSLISLPNLKKEVEYIESVKPLLDTAEREALENSIIAKLNKGYCSSSNTHTPTNYYEILSFISEEEFVPIRATWVDVNDFDESLYKRINIDRFDLLQIIDEFVDYVKAHQESLETSTTSIYIEEIEFKIFKIHIYNIENKKIMQMYEGFDYYISTKSLYHANNIKSIFKHEKRNAIICRFDKIQKFQKRILDNTLTF